MKVQCPQCETPINVDAVYAGRSIKCPKCSQSFLASHKNICDENSSGFWAFRTMLTTKLIIVIFPFWCVLSGLAAVWWAVKTDLDYSGAKGITLKLILAVSVWLLNIIISRVVCEGAIVIFRIHDTLEEIKNKNTG